MNFTWTKAAPTVVGWYWAKIPIPIRPGVSTCRIVPVTSFEDTAGFVSFHCNEGAVFGTTDVDQLGWEWAGPIPLPTEAA